jgi:hypothetical protein
MPKKPSAAKAAAAKFRNANTYTAYLTGADPSLEIGLVENALGHTTFLIRLNRSTTRQVAITSKVFKGGQKHATRAERGHYLIVKDQEVQGVVNTASAYRELRRAGRLNRDIEDGLPDTSGAAAPPLDEAFEMERGEGDEEEENIWAKKDEEHESQTAERLAAILAKRTGAAKKKAIVKEHEDDSGFDLFGAGTSGAADAEEDEMPSEEEGSSASGAAAEPRGRKQADPNSRRSRAAAALSPEEVAAAAAAAAEEDARQAEELARELRELRDAEAEEFLRTARVKNHWDDDDDAVDIDAI